MIQLAVSTELKGLSSASAGLQRLPVWVFGWLLGAVILVAIFGATAMEQSFAEPDSAMRLVQVRDLVAGQAWYDTHQYRLNPPAGVEMHWSRLVDLVIAAPIALLTPLLGATTAEVVVAFAWPLGLLAAFVALMTRIAGELAGDASQRGRVEIAAAVLSALAFPALDRFAPGAFDHHNVVLVLVALAVWGLITAHAQPLRAGMAGAALSLAVIIAAEALPFLAIGAVAAGACWIFSPENGRRPLFNFGCGAAATMLIGFVALVPPSSWQDARCDAFSPNFLWLGLATAITAMALGSKLPPLFTRGVERRLASSVATGLVAAGGLFLLAPGCFGGGYGDVSPQMKELWMAQIAEARSLPQLWVDDPALFFALSGAAFAGLIFAGLELRRRPASLALWVAGGFLIGGVVLMVWQVRGASFATMFAVPFAAVAVVAGQARYRTTKSARALGGFALVVVTASAAGWSAIGQQVQRFVLPAQVVAEHTEGRVDAQACFAQETLASLDAEPAGILLNQFAIGSGVLAASDHAVLAAPYHRNGEGMMAAINAFRGSPDEAHEHAIEAGATHVLICEALPEGAFYSSHPAEGVDRTLAHALDAGEPPDWLEEVEGIAAPLRLYRLVDVQGPELRGRH